MIGPPARRQRERLDTGIRCVHVQCIIQMMYCLFHRKAEGLLLAGNAGDD